MKTTTPKEKHAHPECVVKQLSKYPISDTTLKEVNQKIDNTRITMLSNVNPNVELRQILEETSNSFSIFVSGDHLDISFCITFKKR